MQTALVWAWVAAASSFDVAAFERGQVLAAGVGGPLTCSS
jgi:hypothetical protein